MGARQVLPCPIGVEGVQADPNQPPARSRAGPARLSEEGAWGEWYRRRCSTPPGSRKAIMARNFDGIDDLLQIDSTPVTAAPFTVSAWVRPTNLGFNLAAVFIGNASVSDNFWVLQVEEDNLVRFRVRVSSSANTLTSTTVTVNQWHHICGVEAASNDRRVFLDGGGKGTNSENRVPSGADRVTIGRYGSSPPSDPDGDRHFEGDIGHVAIWNVALSDEEVAVRHPRFGSGC